jgi:hypothetical protein
LKDTASWTGEFQRWTLGTGPPPPRKYLRCFDLKDRSVELQPVRLEE